MKKLPKIKIVSLILTVIMSVIILKSSNYCQTKSCFAYQNSTSEIVIEKDSLRVLHSDNEKIKRSMASTTKIVTAITVIENSNVDDVVEIKKESVGVEGSSIYLREGEHLTVKELLYGLMLRSGNDSADALARYVGGSIEGFSKLMNELANKVGANDSNFTNPHGLSDDGHYTTAYDLAIITAYALKNVLFAQIVSTKSIQISNEGLDYNRVLVNKNKMLNNFDGADGVKTGYTVDAGRCLVSSATRNGMQLICVVLNCGPMFERSSELLNSGFCSYELKEVVRANEEVAKFKMYNPLLECYEEIEVCTNKTITLPLSKEEFDNLKIEYVSNENLCFPVNKEQGLGEIQIYALNKLIFSQKLYIIKERNRYGFFEAISGISRNWIIYEN